MSTRPPSAALPQGDLGLLESDVARRLVASTLPARVAYMALDGSPRVVPTWFHWNGAQLVMPTFISAPHVHRPAGRLNALRANPAVAISIDTEGFPPDILLVRGRAEVTEIDGIDTDYASSFSPLPGRTRRRGVPAADRSSEYPDGADLGAPGVGWCRRLSVPPTWTDARRALRGHQ